MSSYFVHVPIALALVAMLFAMASARAGGPASGADGKRRLRIVLAGDSTVTDRSGWGVGFKGQLADSVECINLSEGGRSSKSFRDEGRWDRVLEQKPDYVLIQFGHNDQAGKGPLRETDPATTYTENMTRYVEEARAIGAVPVLVTSLPRRRFSPDGKINADLLLGYVEAVQKVAAQTQTPLIDLYREGVALLNRIGPVESLEFDPPEKRGSDPSHLGPRGSDVFGKIIARQLVAVVPALKPHIKPQDESD